jgi:hypothetical protein
MAAISGRKFERHWIVRRTIWNSGFRSLITAIVWPGSRQVGDDSLGTGEYRFADGHVQLMRRINSSIAPPARAGLQRCGHRWIEAWNNFRFEIEEAPDVHPGPLFIESKTDHDPPG